MSQARKNKPPLDGREGLRAAQYLRPWHWLFAIGIVIAVFLVYQPAWRGGFIMDDDSSLLNNPVLKPGGLAKVWGPGGYLNYWPVTYTAYGIESRIWGLNPIGFHLVNIAIHAISALLVWRVLIRLRVPGAMLAAAIFALHPVNVESVAWIAQLKNVLSLVLALLSVLFFLAFEREGSWWRLAAALAAFVLSTLAKGMVITLPAVLLACAWWQRGRIGWRDLLRVAPYLLVGAVMAATEVWTQRLVGANTDVPSDSFLSRAADAGCAVWFYLWKLIWPIDLCFVYPRWRINHRDVLSYVPSVLLVVLLAIAWWRRRTTFGRPMLMLIVCYVALLLPVLGFAKIYFMRYSAVADHWQYAAMIVPCAVFAGTAVTLGRWSAYPAWIGYVLCLALLASLGALSWRQSGMYADAETLYRTTIARNPDAWLAHNNLGLILAGRGQVDEAIAHYHKALEINPSDELAHNNLGNALAGRGQFDDAIVHYRKALEIDPDYADAHNNLANVLAGRGQLDEAMKHYRKALEVQPKYAQAHNNLGNVLAGRGQLDEAIAQYLEALKIKPDYADAHNSLGVILAGRGQFDEAIAHFQKALEIEPDYAQVRRNLVDALAARARNER